MISVARHTVCIGVPVQDVECYDFKAGANPETDEDGNFWDYQWCVRSALPQRIGEKACFSKSTVRSMHLTTNRLCRRCIYVLVRVDRGQPKYCVYDLQVH